MPPLPAGAAPWLAHAGGTLDGIAARLDHLSALGVDALYLTPVMRAPSNHKYDAESLDEVDVRFGGDAALDRLAQALRARGMGLFLDAVFNHVGETHPWFSSARADARSPEAAFFRFERHPDRYAHWRGYGHLPELALDRPAVRARLWEDDDSVLARWLARWASGVRLDCANDLGLAACGAIAARARALGARDGALGELMGYPDAWIAEGRLDGVMNYFFRETAVGLCTGEVAPAQAAENLARMAAECRPEALLCSWNMLSSHDVPRLATLVPDRAARALAWALAFSYPGVPLVYYGEEVGMTGGADPENRGPMLWDVGRWDHATHAHLQKLAALRRDHPALREGLFRALPQPGQPSVLAFLRATDDPRQAVVVVANPTAAPVRARVFAPYAHLLDALPLRDLLGGPGTRMHGGRLDVALPPWAIAFYQPDDTTIPGYSFFRP